MARQVAPTKSNLLQLQRELSFAQEGYTLLDRKREVLIMEMMQIMHTIRNLQRRLAKALNTGYNQFRNAYIDLGSEAIERANYAALDTLEISVSERSVMGVPVPEVHAQHIPAPIRTGPMESSPFFDTAIDTFADAIQLLLEYAQANLTLTRLAHEIQKTQRRVNALEHLFIPDTTDAVARIKDTLEESEREDFFRRKIIKKRGQKA